MVGPRTSICPVWLNQVGRDPLQHGGTLVLTGDIQLALQDLRTYNNANYELQLYFTPREGMITQASLALSLRRAAASDPLAVAYDPNVKRPPRALPKANRVQKMETDPALVARCRSNVRPLPLLRPKGEDFVDPSGKPVRFWGMNLVAFYPDHAVADKTADNLASLGINIVRPHHVLRLSTDWDPADTASLLTYDSDSRTPNLKAWDRFDYLNAKLREKGIYISATIHGTRDYLPGDVSILKVSPTDDNAWADAVDELNHWNWHKSFDPRKMLPVFDERCFLLNAEFAKTFLSHTNPYTGLVYGKDSQIVSVEMINEFSSEYTLTCGNVFPDYWTAKLNALLASYASAHGVPQFQVYYHKSPAQARCFSDWCISLDEAYAHRMEKVIRDAGYTGPIEFSNLWRGDAQQRMLAKTDGVVEDHAYEDPLIVKDPDNLFYSCTKSAVAGKPIVIGEFNQAESTQLQQERKSVVPMLPMAAAAYSSLQNYSGIIWFAWAHGVFNIDPDGWGKGDSRNPSNIGLLAACGPILDHLRTAGIIYKNRYLSSSIDPFKMKHVSDSYYPTDYNDLLAGQSPYKPGWQAVHAFRKTFGPVPAGQSTAPWMQTAPANPTMSDTKEIVRDSQRQQLSFAAPKAEGFSGYLDGKPIANLSVLDVAGDSGFATVMVAPLDDLPLVKSRRLIVSRTYSDSSGAESSSFGVSL